MNKRMVTAVAVGTALTLGLAACQQAPGTNNTNTATPSFNAAVDKVYNPSEKKGGIVNMAMSSDWGDSLDPGDTYYGYRDDLLGEVTRSFERHGVPVEANHVELIQGLFQDTISGDEPVAFAHLDGDWYASTMTCLTRLAPRLSTGGRIVVDDYDTWSGCRTAVHEYFTGRPGYRFERRGRLHIVRE